MTDCQSFDRKMYHFRHSTKKKAIIQQFRLISNIRNAHALGAAPHELSRLSPKSKSSGRPGESKPEDEEGLDYAAGDIIMCGYRSEER